MVKYDYQKIRDEVRKIVQDASFAAENQFGSTVWQYHVLPVAEHSLKLGRKMKADLEILELSAYLHDLASLLDIKMYKNHHIHGADVAEEILTGFDYLKNRIKRVRACIMSHRGSVKVPRRSLEARILASADAMAHISEIVDIYYLTFGIHQYKTLAGAEWAKAKLERSWKKIIPEGKRLVRRDYEVAMKQLNKAIERSRNT